MLRGTDRILTTHAGALSGSASFEALDARMRLGEPYDKAAYAPLLRESTADVVRRQVELGIDIISDGELGRARGLQYYSLRIDGITQRRLKPGEVGVTVRKTRARAEFPEFFEEYERIQPTRTVPTGMRMICTAPLKSKGTAAIESEIKLFKEALSGLSASESFFPILAPGWLDHFLFNEYYSTDEEFIFALAQALRPEYQAVIDAGFLLQIDDPGLPDAWPTFFPEPPIEDYRKYATVRIEALNEALKGLPEDRIRYHVCWGSRHGPHTDDLPLVHIVDLMLKVRAQAYSLEAANARHEHEWKIWRDVKLPDGKILIPGVVSHATNTVEHPELIADRVIQFANLVGRENVIAGTDCGMGGRVHSQIGWAKLKVLAEGARLASQRLWPR